jgi:Icc protein
VISQTTWIVADPHLMRDPEGTLFGVNVRIQAERARSFLEARARKGDSLVMLGDISNDDSQESYRRAESLFGSIISDIECVPGNHDGRLFETLQFFQPCPRSKLGPNGWRFHFLDSRGDGEEGRLSRRTLSYLGEAIPADTKQNHAIFFHHDCLQPFPAGRIGLVEGGNELMELIVSRSTSRFAIFCAHRHQSFAYGLGNITFHSVGAVSCQFEFDGEIPQFSSAAIEISEVRFLGGYISVHRHRIDP